jgi:dTDP-4-amino-4,6-dideoxygalactose transaminase
MLLRTDFLWCKRVNPIPPLDLTQQFKSIGDEVNTAVLAVLASAQYINGPVVEGFEQQFAQYIGTDACVSCNSGTDALYLALRSLQIGSGDEVITTPFTFFSSAEVISAVGDSRFCRYRFPNF